MPHSFPTRRSADLVQLGSFPTEGQAKTAWTRVSKRFAYLAPLGQSIEKATVNGNTVYRLRVNAGSADQAKSVCGKLKVAGEACFIPRDGVARRAMKPVIFGLAGPALTDDASTFFREIGNAPGGARVGQE